MALPIIDPIQTSRLMVRAVGIDDLPDLLEINGDPAVTHFLPYATWQTLDDARAWFERMCALVETGSARQMVIVRRADAKIVGTALLFKYDEGSARAELGYVIGRAHWRQGYAREALRALLAHAFEGLHLRRIEAEVNPDNVASDALLRALGFVHEGFLRERWVAKGRAYGVNVYGLLASDRALS